jgi:hypothetical protein
MVFIRYPRPPRIPGFTPEQQRVFEEFIGAFITELEGRDKSALFGPANKDTYFISNVSIQRNFDVSAATLADTKAVLGTLFYDLKRSGRLA